MAVAAFFRFLLVPEYGGPRDTHTHTAAATTLGYTAIPGVYSDVKDAGAKPR